MDALVPICELIRATCELVVLVALFFHRRAR
jgi:hypothetical protein